MQLSHEMIEGLDTHEALVGPFRVFAYLSQDYDASNPLEDCDGLGHIHHHPRSRYGSRSTDYFEVLGLDGNGDPDMEHDSVMARAEDKYEAWVNSLTKEAVQAFLEAVGYEFEGQDEADDVAENFIEYLSDVEPDPNWDKEDYLHGAIYRDATIETILKNQHLLPELVMDWEALWEEARDAGELGDPDAILLDRFEHGLCAYSVHGTSVDPWDTSSCEAVWVPDQCCREEIERRAPVFAQECIDKGMKPLHPGRQIAAREMAITAAEEYTNWCNGSVYGVCVDVFNIDTDELVEEDACWDHIGVEWAEQALKESFDHMVKWAEKEAERVQFPPTTQGV